MKKIRFNKSYVLALVAILLRDERRAMHVASILDPVWVEDDVLADVAEVAIDYLKKYHALPTKLVIREECGEDVVQSKVFKTIMRRDMSDATYVVDRLSAFCRQKAVGKAIIESAQSVKDGDLSGIVDRMQQALAVGQDMSDLGMFYSEYKQRIPYYLSGDVVHGTMPTGWAHVDYLMNGGLAPGELGVIMAPPNRGKSYALVNLAFNATTQLAANLSHDGRGSKVVYYSLEMSDRKLMRRLDKRMSGINASLLSSVPEQFVSKLAAQHRLIRHPESDIVVKKWPTRSKGVIDIHAHLDALEIARGFVPDLVIVDYGDILRADRRLGEIRHEQAGVFEDLRALADIRKVPVWTATQTNRAAASKKVIRMEDIAESFEKCHIADAVITLCCTPEEYEAGQMRLFFAKMRDAQAQQTVLATFNFDVGFIKTHGVAETVSVSEVKDTESKKEKAIEKRLNSSKGSSSKLRKGS